jgi:hypothetical protein
MTTSLLDTMTIQVPERIHILPLGYEYDRVVEPVYSSKANSVYLLEHDEPENEKPEYHTTLKKEFRKNGITVHSVQCDIFDLYSVLGTVAGIITSQADADV